MLDLSNIQLKTRVLLQIKYNLMYFYQTSIGIGTIFTIIVTSSFWYSMHLSLSGFGGGGCGGGCGGGHGWHGGRGGGGGGGIPCPPSLIFFSYPWYWNSNCQVLFEDKHYRCCVLYWALSPGPSFC